MVPWKFFFLAVHFLKIFYTMETLPMRKRKLDQRKLQDFKEDGLNSPKGIQVYEVSM